MGYIDVSNGPDEARLIGSGVHVWALVGYARAMSGDLARVALDYGLTEAEVRAALAYYQQNPQAIDAKLASHAA